MAVSVEAAPRPSLPPPALRLERVRVPARDAELDEVARNTLAALRSIGRACNLDEIYRVLTPRPAFVEVVRAVRRLVKQRLALRIKHEHRYLYQAE